MGDYVDEHGMGRNYTAAQLRRLSRRPTATLDITRWCQATGELLELTAVVSGEPFRADPSVGIGAPGVEDIDVDALTLDDCPLPLCARHWWFELTQAEEQQAEEALLEVLADAALAQWEARHG